MSEEDTEGSWGVSPIQAGAAVVILVFSLVLVLFMDAGVPSREELRDQGVALSMMAYQGGVRLRRGTVIPEGTAVSLRLAIRDPGYGLVYRTDGQGANLGVFPGEYTSAELQAGERVLSDVLAGVGPGRWIYTAIFCEEPFEIKPDKPKASWNCEHRELELLVQ